MHGGRVGAERGERIGSGKGRVQREEGSITVYEFLEMAVTELSVPSFLFLLYGFVNQYIPFLALR